jgi:hypothetical protein
MKRSPSRREQRSEFSVHFAGWGLYDIVGNHTKSSLNGLMVYQNRVLFHEKIFPEMKFVDSDSSGWKASRSKLIWNKIDFCQPASRPWKLWQTDVSFWDKNFFRVHYEWLFISQKLNTEWSLRFAPQLGSRPLWKMLKQRSQFSRLYSDLCVYRFLDGWRNLYSIELLRLAATVVRSIVLKMTVVSWHRNRIDLYQT